jgi:hypothetical protein
MSRQSLGGESGPGAMRRALISADRENPYTMVSGKIEANLSNGEWLMGSVVRAAEGGNYEMSYQMAMDSEELIQGLPPEERAQMLEALNRLNTEPSSEKDREAFQRTKDFFIEEK